MSARGYMRGWHVENVRVHEMTCLFALLTTASQMTTINDKIMSPDKEASISAILETVETAMSACALFEQFNFSHVLQSICQSDKQHLQFVDTGIQSWMGKFKELFPSKRLILSICGKGDSTNNRDGGEQVKRA